MILPVQIIDDIHLTVSVSREVKRSLRERLFSRHPFQKTKIVTSIEPDPNIYLLGNNIIVCHPSIANQIRKELPIEKFDEIQCQRLISILTDEF